VQLADSREELGLSELGIVSCLKAAPNMAEVKDETNIHGNKLQNLYCSSIALVKQQAHMAGELREDSPLDWKA
jgi:hypothetical protein